jgi:hypothetical protein
VTVLGEDACVEMLRAMHGMHVWWELKGVVVGVLGRYVLTSFRSAIIVSDLALDPHCNPY